MTTNAMTINLDDANLPTHGPAWEAMVAHVLENADIGDLYDDAEIVSYVQEAGIPISEIYDDEEIQEAAGSLQHDTIDDYIWGRIKDICREENLPYPEFCPVAITNELKSAMKMREDHEESHRVWTEHRHRLIKESEQLKEENAKLKEDLKALNAHFLQQRDGDYKFFQAHKTSS